MLGHFVGKRTFAGSLAYGHHFNMRNKGSKLEFSGFVDMESWTMGGLTCHPKTLCTSGSNFDLLVGPFMLGSYIDRTRFFAELRTW